MEENTVIAKLLDKVLKDQAEFMALIPEEKRKQGYGRAAQLVIEGPHGGTFDLWFTETGIAQKPPDVPLTNHAWMTEETFRDCITPDLDPLERRDANGRVIVTGPEALADNLEKNGLKYVLEHVMPTLKPRLFFRDALAWQLIIVDGDTSAYDSEEWAQVLEKLIIGKLFPRVVRAIVEREKEAAPESGAKRRK